MPANQIDYFNPADDAARKRKIGRRILWAAIVLIVVIGAIGATATVIGVYLHRMHARLKRADALAVIVNSRLAGDARFAEVNACEFTKHDGCLLISGLVDSQADLNALHQIVQSTSPPVYVDWMVDVGSPEQLRRSRQTQASDTAGSQPVNP